MATTYKTPGVYIEEIPKFPPSIAAVETAIPAFIGYTEKAERNGESLYLRPTRIESIAEYELFFGGGPSQDVTLTLDTNNQVVKTESKAKFYLYDSLRMFYANGGGNCYIVSIAGYGTPQMQHFLDGIAEIAKEDEPTIILCPDAAALGGTDLYNIQVEGIKQCARLMDRVVLCDLKNSDDFRIDVQEFRNNIGINNLKYAGAYGPWINVNLPRLLMRRNVKILSAPSGTTDILDTLTTDTSIKNLLATIASVEAIVDGLPSDEAGLSTPHATLERKLSDLKTAYDPTNIATLQDITAFLAGILDELTQIETNAPNPSASFFKIKTDLASYRANSGLVRTLKSLASHHNSSGLDVFVSGSAVQVVDYVADSAFDFTANAFGDTPALSAISEYATATTTEEKSDIAYGALIGASRAVFNAYRYHAQTIKTYEIKLNESLTESFGLYKTLVAKAAEALNTIPPSGAIAGVYASVDRDRGVWKTPANVSLNAVIGPAVKISQEQQGEYNVDVNAGKSINIIRSFTGKGTLVWGGRTLAGNDNEWRYISVRRLFNFVEESVKKATEQFVFEPNDANTWVRVQAMIENFLNTLWRQGALQGVKPEHAFYVAVGLGKTMTALDILEGRMIVEIGMAAVRPAEFIILRFSHKMPES